MKKISVSFEEINSGLQFGNPKKRVFDNCTIFTMQIKDNLNSKSHIILNIIGSHYTRYIHDS